jgi:predicted Rossmann-fold nucleotide-binding protein
MNDYLELFPYDLVTPDGSITKIQFIDELHAEATVFIEKIPPKFVGFQLDPEKVFFNIKSSLAQVGVDGIGSYYTLDKNRQSAEVIVQLRAIGAIGQSMLKLLKAGAFIGKLFAADDRRRVRNPDYISRMFGRSDRWGRPLLSLGGLHGSNDLILDVVDGRAIAYLTLKNGRLSYSSSIGGFLPTLARALERKFPVRDLVQLNQEWNPDLPHNIEENELLLVKTLPLHIRTVFGRVVNELLSSGYQHTTASILQPDTMASGDVYELFGNSKRELTDIPLEFYTLEPYREYVFFSDRDQLQACLENSEVLFKAFSTAPEPLNRSASVFVVKGTQLLELKPKDWIVSEPRLHEFPGIAHGTRQALMVERYIEQQPSYAFLKAIDDEIITSQGILLCRYFPSPLLKRMLLSDQVQRALKGIYFQHPSLSYGDYFSSEDRALLNDLNKFAIPVFWVDQGTGNILQYIQKRDKDSGMFIPLDSVDTFLKSTVFGVYGSNLTEGNFEKELKILLQGVLEMRDGMNHPLLKKNTPLTLVTGGGPGAMGLGNRVAKELSILSCANIVDFRAKLPTEAVVNEQNQNPYIQGKMTYRLDKLVERQAEFNLDFPIFLMGGIGTDFELALEEVRRKVGSAMATPIILFGASSYWKEKISSRFRCNLENGTIKGSEWISNCFYCIQKAEQGIKIYREFFQGILPIGKEGPIYEDGFVEVPPLT